MPIRQKRGNRDADLAPPYLELPELKSVAVIAGYRFSFALTVDDLICLRDLRMTG